MHGMAGTIMIMYGMAGVGCMDDNDNVWHGWDDNA